MINNQLYQHVSVVGVQKWVSCTSFVEVSEPSLFGLERFPFFHQLQNNSILSLPALEKWPMAWLFSGEWQDTTIKMVSSRIIFLYLSEVKKK